MPHPLRLKDRSGYDDLAINASGAATSLSLVGVTVAYSFVATLALLKPTDLTVELRLSDEHEDIGLDLSQHGEVAYRIGED